jgi:hypothetical protein
MPKFRLRLRTMMILVALLGLLAGAEVAWQRREFCLKQAREFGFWEEMNRGRIAGLEAGAAANRDSSSVLHRTKAADAADQAVRARIEAERCARVRRMYEYTAARPWLPLPPAQPAPQYAPYR